MELLIFAIFSMIVAIVAGLVASALFDVALRFGVFGRRADGTPPRVCKIYVATVPIGFVAAYLGLALAMSFPQGGTLALLAVPSVLTVLIVIGIKLVSMRCAARGCRRRRATRDPNDSNTIDPTDAGRVAFAPTA